jgi:hypothetical protein
MLYNYIVEAVPYLLLHGSGFATAKAELIFGRRATLCMPLEVDCQLILGFRSCVMRPESFNGSYWDFNTNHASILFCLSGPVSVCNARDFQQVVLGLYRTHASFLSCSFRSSVCDAGDS